MESKDWRASWSSFGSRCPPVLVCFSVMSGCFYEEPGFSSRFNKVNMESLRAFGVIKISTAKHFA